MHSHWLGYDLSSLTNLTVEINTISFGEII